METNQIQTKVVQFVQKNKSYVISAAVVVVLIAFFSIRAATSDETKQESATQTSSEQTSSENTNSEGEKKEEPKEASMTSDSAKSDSDKSSEATDKPGTVNVTGTLQASDNSAKGNVMIDSSKGKVYVSTKHDYSAQYGKQVTLTANGTLQSFTLATIRPSNAPQEAVATSATLGTKPAEVATTGTVKVTGTLEKSDSSRGNYVVNSSQGKIYLQSGKDYSALVGQTVTLTANGTVNSFTGAVLSK